MIGQEYHCRPCKDEGCEKCGKKQHGGDPLKPVKRITDKIIYISGPMTGIKDLNFAAFKAAEDVLRSMRAQAILNPHASPPGMNYDQYMHLDYAMIDIAETIILLDGWIDSQGARKEIDYATRKYNKNILHWQQLLDLLNSKEVIPAAIYNKG